MSFRTYYRAANPEKFSPASYTAPDAAITRLSLSLWASDRTTERLPIIHTYSPRELVRLVAFSGLAVEYDPACECYESEAAFCGLGAA